jgi:hypothetical protein
MLRNIKIKDRCVVMPKIDIEIWQMIDMGNVKDMRVINLTKIIKIINNNIKVNIHIYLGMRYK